MRHPLTEIEFDHSADFSRVVTSNTLFKEFNSRTARKLVELGIEAHFEAGKAIFKERDQSGQFFYITSGSVAIEQPAPDHPVRIQTLHEGDFLGWSALLGSGTRHFQARALTQVTVLTFDGDLLRKECDDNPPFGYALMKRLLLLVTERLDMVRAQLGESRRSEVRACSIA